MHAITFFDAPRINRRRLIGVMAAAMIPAWRSGALVSATSPEGSRSAPVAQGDMEVRRNIVYREVDGQSLLLDVYMPTGAAEPRAAVMYVHGGGWRHGNKDGKKPQTVCTDLVKQGFVAISIDYRLAPAFVYPAAIEDVEAAVAWLRKPEVTGEFAIDPARIGAIGSSAGGNLVGLLGSRGAGPHDQGSRIAAVVSFSGPMILTTEALDFGGAELDDADVVLEYLGCSDVNQCPAEKPASPVTWVDPTDPPYLLINSEDENRVKPEQAEVMADALRAAGVKCDVMIRPGNEHGIEMWSDREIREATMAFLHRHLDAAIATPPA